MSLNKVIFFLFIIFNLNVHSSNDISIEKLILDRTVNLSHSEKYSKILTIDKNGRIKPFHTTSSEILRKIARKSNMYGLTASQIVIAMSVDPLLWQMVPIIKVPDEDILKIIGKNESHVAFTSFFLDNQYLLSNYVESAFSKKPIDRTKFDKKIIEVDERINICSMIFSDQLIKIFPSKEGPWSSDVSMDIPGVDSLKTQSFKSVYRDLIYSSFDSDNWQDSDMLLDFVINWQNNYAGNVLPSKTKVNAEIFYNNLDPFGWKRLFLIYFLSGCILLLTLLIAIFYKNKTILNISKFTKIFISFGFLLHLFALGLRWYVSGHAPWSDAYESVIFISFATMIAGVIFSKKSSFALSAACLVAAMLLVVANLNWLNPEMTNLVPVLNSYWLMIHVSVITSSYGFFGLCAFIGFLNLILIILSNKEKIKVNVKELTSVNEQSMILGLFLLTVGTFLGGVWANESWGRYWGWDPKETWALVSIIVYSVILHLRLLKSKSYNYLFNFFALFGFSSILMTYFGVNYYLDGLHSYAAGDAFPIPTFVFPTLCICILISTISFIRFKKWLT